MAPAAFVSEEVPVASSLLQEFTAQQHANVFLRAFSFPTAQLPVISDEAKQLANQIVMMDEIGFVFQVMEREQTVASRLGDLEKWVVNHVVRRGVKQIQRTRELLETYMGLSLVNGFGHRVLVTPKDPELVVSVIIYRVPPKTRAFRAARFRRNKKGDFVHILRDTEYFEIARHFATPAELLDYFTFRQDVLIAWDPASAGVSETALIGQYLLEDYASQPDERFEKVVRRRGATMACEFSFLLDSLANIIATQDSDYADTDFYEILSELGRLERHELRAIKRQVQLALEAVRAERLELPYRLASARTGCGFLILAVNTEFHDRALEALTSLGRASKYELDLDRQVGIGMWRGAHFVEVEWTYLIGKNMPDHDLDQKLARNYPFRRTTEQRLSPIFT
jgi:hypothetical protein